MRKIIYLPCGRGRSAESILQRSDMHSPNTKRRQVAPNVQRGPRNRVPLSLCTVSLRPCSTGRRILQVATDATDPPLSLVIITMYSTSRTGLRDVHILEWRCCPVPFLATRRVLQFDARPNRTTKG